MVRGAPGAADAQPAAVGAPDHDLRGLLAIVPFRRLWLSLGLSSFGDWLGLLAATAMAASLGGQSSYSAANLAVSGVLILRLAPSVLLGPVAGALADRFDRKMLMVVGDLLRFLIFLSIPIVGTLWWLFVATVLAEIVGLFWAPAKDASVPNIVPKERLETANQLSLATTYGSAPVAALLFTLLSLSAGVMNAVLVGVSPADVAMGFNAFTYLVAALVIVRLEIPRRQNGPAQGGQPSVVRAIIEGWAFVRDTRLVRGLVTGMLGAFAAGGFVIGVAPTFATDLGAGAAAYGVLFASVFTGLALGMWVGPRLLRKLARWRLFAVALTGAGVCLLFVALIANIVTAVLFTTLLGMCAGVSWVTGYTLLGVEVADDVRGRTFAFVQNGAKVVLIAVMALAPGLAAVFGERRLEITDNVQLDYNGAALTLLVASVITVAIGVVSYRTMDDGQGSSLRQDLRQALIGAEDGLTVERLHSPVTGCFVVFEGGDGAGKSTQVHFLVQWLRDLGHETVVTREPGGTELGQSIRQLVLHRGALTPHAEALLFAADRAQHVADVIHPALERDAVVICDRYIDSTLAYQGAGRGFDPASLARISHWATGALVPDLTVLLDISPQEARRRMAEAGRTPDRMEQEDPGFHARVREGFLDRARRAPRRYLVLDATRPADELAERVRARLTALLPVRPEPGRDVPASVPAESPGAGNSRADDDDPWFPA